MTHLILLHQHPLTRSITTSALRMSRALRLRTRSGAGIYPEYVEMEIDDVRELAFSAAQQAYAASSELPVPKTFKQAMAGAEKAQWEETCQQEIAAHMENGTWRLVELPHGRTPVG